MELALDAVRAARNLSLPEVSGRLAEPPFYPDVWPGEHYRLLAGIVQVLKPQNVVEIGTGSGLSALSLKKCLPVGGKVTTFDLIPWTMFPGSVLREGDFFGPDGLVQHCADLRDPRQMENYRDVVQRADLLFIDAAKDGRMESVLMENLVGIGLPRCPILVFDDTRLWNMLAFWRGLSLPKLDLTSFGHWSGTGLAEWVPTKPGGQ